MLKRLKEIAAARGDAAAVSNEDGSWTFRMLARRADEWRHLIASAWRGRRPTVAIRVAGGPELTACLLGCWDTPATVIPLALDMTEWELARCCDALDRSIDVAILYRPVDVEMFRRIAPDATVILVPGEASQPPQSLLQSSEEVRQIVSLPPVLDLEEVWQVQFTSGSTGTPKGVLLSRSAWLADLAQTEPFTKARKQMPVFCPSPQTHAMAAALCFEHLLAGASVHVANRFDPDRDLFRMRTAGVEVLAAGASYLRFLLRAGRLHRSGLPSLKEVILGAEPADAALFQELWSEWPGLVIHVRYGVSESVGALTRLSLSSPSDDYSLGLVGEPLPGVELRIAPSDGETHRAGEILARTRAAGMGVLRDGLRVPLRDQDGWLATGDIGELDGKGRARLMGRGSWMIKRNGFRLHPFEVEAALRLHAGVAEAVVIGLSKHGNERLIAVVVPRGGAAPRAADLLEHSRRLLSPHKVPHEVRFWDRLPLNAGAKIDRLAIHDRLIRDRENQGKVAHGVANDASS